MKKIVNAILLSGLLCAPVLSHAKEPQNLAALKAIVIEYHDSGEYDRDINAVIDKASRYVIKHQDSKQQHGKKPAILLDIDETSLSNYADMKRLDFGGTIEEIRADEDKGSDPAIEPTLKLAQYAKKHGMAIIFLTGRHEEERDMTAKNLKKVGYPKWDKLILRFGPYQSVPASVYKTAMRKQLVTEGYDIIVNVGDQYSDLRGGYADKTYKLPNPYYLIQ